jgi:RimJ/RimL family protein N-acetyltransferase
MAAAWHRPPTIRIDRLLVEHRPGEDQFVKPDELVLDTDRLWIRQWNQSDAERVLDIQSRWDVVRWLDDDAQVMSSLEQARAGIDRRRGITEIQGVPCGHWAVEVKETGVVAGAVLLVLLPTLNRPADVREIQIGWHLHPDSSGRGYAREAAAAALAYGFDQGVETIRALMFVDNTPSARVARALGMTLEGTVTDQWYAGDSLLFVATADSETEGHLR